MPYQTHDFYSDWVMRQIRGEALDETPARWLEKHGAGWRGVFAGMLQAGGVLEVPALVISRWELLGSLYRGNIGRTGSLDAIVFARRFLEPVNPRYSKVHNIVGRQNQEDNQSDIFMMARNKPLHGANPAGIETEDGSGIAGWLIGPGPTGGRHLELDQNGNLHFDGAELFEELLEGMTLFASYLDENTEREGDSTFGNHLPQERWLRAFWARFKPHARDNLQSWMLHGARHGVPA